MIKRKRIVTGFCLLLIIPLGMLAKEYQGPCDYLISDKVTGSLYVVFWSLFFYFFFHHIHLKVLVIAVFVVTCLLEFLQLVTSPFLEILRSHYIGRALLGNTFNWNDFIFYFLGAVLSFIILQAIEKSHRE